jgi:hypothetical protein
MKKRRLKAFHTKCGAPTERLVVLGGGMAWHRIPIAGSCLLFKLEYLRCSRSSPASATLGSLSPPQKTQGEDCLDSSAMQHVADRLFLCFSMSSNAQGLPPVRLLLHRLQQRRHQVVLLLAAQQQQQHQATSSPAAGGGRFHGVCTPTSPI